MMFGTPPQGNTESQFYFDSTVTYTSVTTTECVTCNTTYYNSNASSTYKSVPGITGIQYQLPTVEVTGKMASDTVCVNSADPTNCVGNFQFFMIQDQIGMEKGIDGTVGLGPPNNGPSIVEALYDQGVIKTPIVSFQLN
jgi:hypothetical protein